MARAYLQLVNDVLVRLRESPVSTVSQTSYSSLIGALVNDSKREVEDSWQWSALLDYLTWTTTPGLSSYETNSMLNRYSAPPISAPAGCSDRTRLWIDDIESSPICINVTLNKESKLTYEPILTKQLNKQIVLNNSSLNNTAPSSFQIGQSTFYTTSGLWNKAVLLYAIPDLAYTMQLFVVNPQTDLSSDTDILKVPHAPVVQKAYLYALYERGEELGETLTLTSQKVENTLGDAISLDQQFSQQYLQLVVPYGAQY